MEREQKRLSLSAKLGMAAGALFISGAAAMGIGIYKSIENENEINDARAKITSDLSEEKRAKLISEIPEKDMTARWTVAGGLLIFVAATLPAGVALAEGNSEEFQKRTREAEAEHRRKLQEIRGKKNSTS